MNFIKKSREYLKSNNLKGPSGFLKFVILNCVDSINQVTNDFIFKGGNLLWLYIKTPRATVDIDFVTKTKLKKNEILAILEKASKLKQGITFEVEAYKEFKKFGYDCATLTIKYTTDSGGSNKFFIDIIIGLNSNFCKLPLFLEKESEIVGAPIEDIIFDKIDACHRYKSGNTRIKDYDDLYRIVMSGIKYDKAQVKKALDKIIGNEVLNLNWITDDMQGAWKKHQNKYKDLPESLEKVFLEIRKKLV